MSDNLKQKAVTGVVWTTIQRFSLVFLHFISGMILARLLSPDDYGCIGMLAIFMTLADLFVDGGFCAALIQKKNPTQTDYSTIFFWNIAISIVVYLILFISAPAIARFYRIDLLCSVLRVQGLTIIVGALSTVQIAILNKNFEFRKRTIISLITCVSSLVISSWMAYNGFGVWSLVALNMMSTLLPTAMYWATSKWKPSWLFSWESFKKLFDYSVFIFLSNCVSTIVGNVQGLLIGRKYNPTTMGYYSKAKSTADLVSTSVSSVLAQVTFPLYSELQDDRNRTIYTIKHLTTSIAYLSFPLILLLILLAEPVFILLYSDKWLPSVPYFQLLCIAGIPTCLQSSNAQTLTALGLSRVTFRWTLVKQLSGLAIMLCGMALYGIWGLLAGMVFSTWLNYFINISLVSHYIGYGVFSQLKSLIPMILLSGVAMVGGYIVSVLLPFNMYVVAIVEFVVFVGIYLGGSVIFKVGAMKDVVDMVKILLLKYKRK